MKILIVGSGAREHAIARALKKSIQNPLLYCCGTSNNPGIQSLATDYWRGDIGREGEILKIACQWEIDMAIIGPEAPLERGLADLLWANSIGTIGPQKKLSTIETSKAFTRDLMKKYDIPGSPTYRVFYEIDGVKSFLQQLGEGNYVIKANGLMGGKGVKVAGDHLHSIKDAYQFCHELLALGQSLVIEEKLIGQEFSLLCFCDGISLIPMPLIQDHKRAFVNDEGPNTGGMGSYSDANHRLPFLTEKEFESAQHINERIISALTSEYHEAYQGILYGSFMVTKEGVRLIEYNARFGDPEAMNALAILESDFVGICEDIVARRLSRSNVRFKNQATVCKYAVPEGYPDHPIKNESVDVSNIEHPEFLYFGAIDKQADQLIATGSRALAVLGVGATIHEAEKMAENEINRIRGKLFHRKDIGTADLINRRIQQMRDLRLCYV